MKSNRLALMWAMPFGIGLALFGGDLVTFGLGDRWTETAPLIRAFGATTALAHVGFKLGRLLPRARRHAPHGRRRRHHA